VIAVLCKSWVRFGQATLAALREQAAGPKGTAPSAEAHQWARCEPPHQTVEQMDRPPSLASSAA